MSDGPQNSRGREAIAKDTILRTNDIVSQHVSEGASLESTFISDQMPPLEAANSTVSPHVAIQNSDSFTAAREIIRRYPEAQGKTAVLNLASDEVRGGGWEHSLSKTQEEALCYSSTLYATLKESYYPWPNLGPGSIAGVYSPGVVIFKDDLDHGCADLLLEERRVVSVITVAAPRFPQLSKNGGFKNASDLDDLRGKIRLVYRMAAHNGNKYVVLGAMGCGAYRCPPMVVAKEMKSILSESEFKGHFHEIVFAIYSSPTIGSGNFDIFEKVFKKKKNSLNFWTKE